MRETVQAAEAGQIRHALRAGDVDGAVQCLQNHEDPSSAALWLQVGRWAGALGGSRQARACFARSAELDPQLGPRALLEMAQLAGREGAHREEARARAAAWRAEETSVTQPEVRAQRLAEIGFAYLRSRNLAEARSWLEQAVQTAPDRWDARSALVRLAGEDEDRAALERWVAAAPAVPAHAAGWWTARGEAARACRDPEAAAQHFDKALNTDAEALDAAEHLVRLGVEVGQDIWIDAGLAALRSRCMALGDVERGFIAAALEVARGTSNSDARRVYRTLRVALSTRLRTGTGAWLSAWLGAVGPGSAAEVAPELGAPLELPQGHLRALEELSRAFGVSEVRAHNAESWCAVAGAPAGLGIPPSSPPGVRRARFWYGRALAALCAPSLGSALATPVDEARPSAEHRFLDRAGLVGGLDPAVGLLEVGPSTARGRALTGFAVSSDFGALWKVLGLGLRPPLPKLGPGA